MSKHILFLSRHFPPIVSGGARRSGLMAHGLAERGHKVFVVAPLKPENLDGLLVPHPQPEPPTDDRPARRRSARDMLREKLLLPDPDIRWSLRVRREIIAHNIPRPDWIISSSPPESLHVAACLLQRHFKTKWLADFRDHWIENPLRPERRNAPLRSVIEKALASQILKRASAITAVDEPIACELLKYAPDAPATVIGHFAEPIICSKMLPANTINIVHTGSFTLSDPDRSIAPLLTVFNAARAQNPQLALHLAGRLTDGEIAQVKAHKFSCDIHLYGVVTYIEARGFQAAADILLLAIAPLQMGVPGKYAEYKLSGKPVLVLRGEHCLSENNGQFSIKGGSDVATATLANTQKAQSGLTPNAEQARNDYEDAIDRFHQLLTSA